MSINLDFWKLLAGLGIFLFGMLLTQEQINSFDRAMDAKEIMDDEKGRSRTDAHPKTDLG